MSGRLEYRVCILNDGTPHGPLELTCGDRAAAERKRESWAKDPDVGDAAGAQVWIESRVIGPWERLDG